MLDLEEEDNDDSDYCDQQFERQLEAIDLLHKLSNSKDGRVVPVDRERGTTRAHLRINALLYYLSAKGLLNMKEYETYAAEYMEWYIDHEANKTDEEYGKYYIDIDNVY